MALLSFPPSPTDGQLYPVAPPAGTLVYQWDAANQTWVIIGKSTGATAGTYGSPTSIPQITITSTGLVTSATEFPIQVATTSSTGIIQVGNHLVVTGAGLLSVNEASAAVKGVVNLVANATTNDNTKAATASVVYDLQQQIDTLSAQVAAISSQLGDTVITYFDDISPLFDNFTTLFPLQINGVITSPVPVTNILVFLGGVAQQAGFAYVVTGSAITFTEPPEPGTVCTIVTINR